MLGDTFSYKILLNKLGRSALFVHDRLWLDAGFYRGLTLQLCRRWRHLWLFARQLRLSLLRHRLRRWINHVLCLKLDGNLTFLRAKTSLSATWAWLSDGGCCEYWCCKSGCWITLGCCCCWYCCCCCSCCCCWYCCCSDGTCCCITFCGGCCCCWYCCWYCHTHIFFNQLQLLYTLSYLLLGILLLLLLVYLLLLLIHLLLLLIQLLLLN